VGTVLVLSQSSPSTAHSSDFLASLIICEVSSYFCNSAAHISKSIVCLDNKTKVLVLLTSEVVERIN